MSIPSHALPHCRVLISDYLGDSRRFLPYMDCAHLRVENFTSPPSSFEYQRYAIFVYHSIEWEFTATARAHDDICYRLGLQPERSMRLWMGLMES